MPKNVQTKVLAQALIPEMLCATKERLSVPRNVQIFIEDTDRWNMENLLEMYSGYGKGN